MVFLDAQLTTGVAIVASIRNTKKVEYYHIKNKET